MEGHGFYNQHSQQQANAATRGYELWQRALDEVPLHPAFRLADFGSSQGRNSLEPMRRAVESLRSRQADLEIEVTHTDLPQNDFNSLIELVSGPDTYLRPGVYSGVRGASFYGPLFPDASLSLGWSSIATHWLSRAPDMPGVIFSSLVSDPCWKEQARQDWETWVACRSRELRPGGQVVMVNSAADDAGLSGAEPLMEAVQETLREVLPADEVARMVIPTYYRTRAEWLAPLGHGLEVVEAEDCALDDLYWAELQKSGDREKFAEAVVGFWKAAFAPALLGDRDIQDFYARLRARLVANPERGRCSWRLMLLRLRRP